MKAGDLVKFTSGYTGIILEFTKYNDVAIFVNEPDVPFKNPTYMSIDLLERSAEVISSAETNSQSTGR